MKKLFAATSVLYLVSMLVPGCGDSGSDGGGGSTSTGTGTGGRLEETGATCEVPDDCYPDVVDGELAGDAICLDRVRGGYCTHECTTDEDCCGAEGECKTGISQVCSPFESTGQNMCFLSCEDEDLLDGLDESEFCQRDAGRDFICRSSGGGSNNRKICVPGDCGVGAACSADADCTGDLECITGLTGGYCSRRDCTTNADCPADTNCVEHVDGNNYCMKQCAGASDCTFCRGYGDTDVTCSDDVAFAEDGTTGSVCVPG